MKKKFGTKAKKKLPKSNPWWMNLISSRRRFHRWLHYHLLNMPHLLLREAFHIMGKAVVTDLPCAKVSSKFEALGISLNK